MLKSLFLNTPRTLFHIYMIHDDLDPEAIEFVRGFCEKNLAKLIPIRVPDGLFDSAPVNFYYSRAMYYRLLAFNMLPANLDRILYLDPDILAINSVRPLYDMDISPYLFAAAAHVGLTNLATYVNQVRLSSFDSEHYYNSGVLLMNLRQQRKEIDPEKLFMYVRDHGDELILPDQDVLNVLYGKRILALDAEIYNYDCRCYETYLLKSLGTTTMDWIMQNTVLLHFCGKKKPWTSRYSGRFGMLFKHYTRLAERHFTVQKMEARQYAAVADTDGQP